MELQRVALDAVEEQIRRVLSRFPAVSGAYLFGSCLGVLRPDSDIDLGLILRVDPASPLTDVTDVEVEAELGAFDGHPYHVTTLSAEAVTFSFGVVNRGRLVFEADPDRVGDFLARVAIAHDDLAPFLDSYRGERGRALDAFR